MLFTTALIALIASTPSLLTSALPTENSLLSRDNPNSECGVAFYVGSVGGGTYNSAECRVSTSILAGGHGEDIVHEDKACDQENFSWSSAGTPNMGVGDFTITQSSHFCDQEGWSCDPTLALADGTTLDMVSGAGCTNGTRNPVPGVSGRWWRCQVDCPP